MFEATMRDKEVELTSAELEVLRLAAEGLTNKEIATRVYLSKKTIDHMLGSDVTRGIYPKINVKSRAEATAWYLEKRTTYRDLRDWSDSSLYWIHRVRIGGQPRLAMEQAEEMATLLRQKIDSKFRLIGGLKPLLNRLAHLLFEQLIAFYEIAPPGQIWSFAKLKIKEMRDIARTCDDEELHSLAEYGLGMAYYLLGDPLRSVQALDQAWIGALTNDDRLKILRTKALDWAYLKEQQHFKEMAVKAENLIQDGNFSDLHFVCMAYEGLGRGQGILNLPTAFEMLERGWQTYHKLIKKRENMPIRYVQLARSELEVAQHLQPRDKQWLEERAKEGLRLANEYGYPRYTEQIERLLEWSFN